MYIKPLTKSHRDIQICAATDADPEKVKSWWNRFTNLFNHK